MSRELRFERNSKIEEWIITKLQKRREKKKKEHRWALAVLSNEKLKTPVLLKET